LKDVRDVKQARMPLVMAHAINNLRLNSVKILKKKQKTVTSLLASSFSTMMRRMTVEDLPDSPNKKIIGDEKTIAYSGNDGKVKLEN